jgi:two-component system chemotaxis sensor kinase CheA
LASETLRAAFLVDEFIAELPILVKDLGPYLQGLPLVKGGTILDNGAVGLILDATRLLQDGCASGQRDRGVTAAGTPPATSKRILLADDSVTTRALVRSILEAAGYDVVAVSDGAEAWDKLQDGSFDLLVSDVEMPRMDGFLLTESIRQSRRLRQLPVVLVTARESDADRLRGAEAGADAYLGKSAFDQSQLLVTLGQIL